MMSSEFRNGATMWINTKEWIVFSGCLVLILVGILYLLLKPHYRQYYIKNLQSPRTISITADEKEIKTLVIKVDGVSSEDYVLKLRFLKKEKEATYLSSRSEEIFIPAGVVVGKFERSFTYDQKAEIRYSSTKISANGTIRLDVGIF